MLTERQFNILKILHDSCGYIPINDIATQIHFSPKTVRNDISKIQEYVEQNEFGTLIKTPKKGTLFQTTREKWEKLQSMDAASRHTDSPSARKFLICKYLLTGQSTSITELEKQMFLARNGVEKALQEAKKWLQERNIRLQITRGKGIRLLCTEFQRRLALFDLFLIIQKKADTDGKISNKEGFTYKLVTIEQISTFLDGFNALNVICALQETESQFGIQFEYESQKQLIFLLSLMLFRIKSKKVIHKPLLKTESKFNRWIADDLADRLEKRYQISLQTEERDYLVFCVSISEIEEFTDQKSRFACEKSQLEFCGFIAKLINVISETLGIDLKGDKLLAQSLFLYLRTAVERLRYGIRAKNPFLPKIKTEYPNIFAAAWTTSILLENDTGMRIGEDEIGFVTLYIGGAIERVNSNVKVCVLCNYGVGISQFLRQRIERSIPNIEVVDVVTAHDTQRIIKSGCDFIITTQNIGNTFAGKDVVIVDNFLLPYDVRIIKQKIFEVCRKKMNRISKEKNLRRYPLFDSKFVRILDTVRDKSSLLQDMCLQLEQKGYVAKGFFNSVLEREIVTSTEIGKQVAIPHGSTKFVVRPIISVAILKKPVIWNNNEPADLIFLLAIKADPSLHVKAQIMKFYSVLGSLTDDDAKLKRTKSIQDPKKFASYMNQLTEGENDETE